MELYKLIATIKNTAPDTVFTFAFIPENFEGVKISQQFSFVNPIGYTPKFSIDTMRIIASDKAAIDSVFLTYGLESDVEIEIQKLNALGTAYEIIQSFAIDFESYEISDYYSEFALKSISIIDYYNKVKNTEIQLDLINETFLPNTQKFINYVSLKKKGFFNGSVLFQKNNEAKIYNKDAALYSILDVNQDAIIYSIGQDALVEPSLLSISINANLIATGYNGTLNIGIYKWDVATSSEVLIWMLISQTVVSTGTVIQLEINSTDIGLATCRTDDYLVITDISNPAVTINGEFFVDIKKVTDILVVNSTTEIVKYITLTELLNTIFNNNITIPSDVIYDFGLTSANQISKLNDFINLKPKEFLYDFCLASGSILNFKTTGEVEIELMGAYFNNLLAIGNAHEITNFKDVSIRYNMQLNFASVDVGQQISTYDVFTYPLDWNKILTFNQPDRNASENLDLTLTKFRTDFSGILDYFFKRSKQQQKTSKDNFIFDPAFGTRNGTDPDVSMYDSMTPKDILLKWKRFLSFCFQNFGLAQLDLSSNGGNLDNMKTGIANPIYQLSNYTISETPRLLPIEYNLTAIIGNVDFSEKILKINHEGEDVYLFVINAETMDNFSEQKIKGLKIQF